MKYSRAIKNFGYKEGVDYPHRSLIHYMNEKRFLSQLRKLWQDTAPLQDVLADKRHFTNMAEKAKTRAAKQYFLALAKDNSIFIQRNAGWWRRFDRYLAGGHYEHAYRVLEVLFGRWKLLRYRTVNYNLDMESQNIMDEDCPHFKELPVYFKH